MTIAFLAVTLCIFPFIRWQRGHESGNCLTIIVASGMWGLYAWYLIDHPLALPIDPVSLALYGFAAWIVLSLSWGKSSQGLFDALTWLGCLTVFFVARQAPAETVLLLCVVPAPVLCAHTLWQRIRGVVPAGIIGNTNHSAALYLVYFFAALWLAGHVSPWFNVLALLCALGIVASRCRAATVALFAGLFVVFIDRPFFIAVGIVCVAALLLSSFFILKHKNRLHRFYSAERISFYYVAGSMILQRPFFGWGLRMFRREYPVLCPHVAHVVGRNPEHFSATHRVHNDHLEVMVETGMVGYGLFILIFYQSLLSAPALFPIVAAFMIDACFFFPFRETHTAIPFWAVLGALTAGIPADPAAAHYAQAGVCSLAAIAVTGVAYRKLAGIYWYSRARKLPVDNNRTRYFLARAVRNDPNNAKYLDTAAVAWVSQDMLRSLIYAVRNIVCFDGGRVKWGLYDNLARVVLSTGHLKIARYLTDQALLLNSRSDRSRALSKTLVELEALQKKARMEAKTHGVNH